MVIPTGYQAIVITESTSCRIALQVDAWHEASNTMIMRTGTNLRCMRRPSRIGVGTWSEHTQNQADFFVGQG
jgi:hypothetical protein